MLVPRNYWNDIIVLFSLFPVFQTRKPNSNNKTLSSSLRCESAAEFDESSLMNRFDEFDESVVWWIELILVLRGTEVMLKDTKGRFRLKDSLCLLEFIFCFIVGIGFPCSSLEHTEQVEHHKEGAVCYTAYLIQHTYNTATDRRCAMSLPNTP